jgi:phospholipid transport system substrate-binding protein
MTFLPAVRRFLVAIALTIPFAAGTARADGAQDAATFINNFGNKAIAQLTDPSLSDEELYKRFRVLFEEGFDVPYIAKSALGRFWPRASEQEKAEYSAAFEDYMVQVYAGKFRAYSGQTLEVTGGQPAPEGGVTVASTVVKPDHPVTIIHWTVDSSGGKPKIRDIKIEGVSMITTYRDEFANEILQRDGKVAGLISALREKTGNTGVAGNGHGASLEQHSNHLIAATALFFARATSNRFGPS